MDTEVTNPDMETDFFTWFDGTDFVYDDDTRGGDTGK